MERVKEEADVQLCHTPPAGSHRVITKVERQEQILAFIPLCDVHT